MNPSKVREIANWFNLAPVANRIGEGPKILIPDDQGNHYDLLDIVERVFDHTRFLSPMVPQGYPAGAPLYPGPQIQPTAWPVLTTGTITGTTTVTQPFYGTALVGGGGTGGV